MFKIFFSRFVHTRKRGRDGEGRRARENDDSLKEGPLFDCWLHQFIAPLPAYLVRRNYAAAGVRAHAKYLRLLVWAALHY